MIYFKIFGAGGAREFADDSASFAELACSQKHTSFDSMYSKVTEKVVEKVLECEMQRRDHVPSELEYQNTGLPQAFLLIGENDANLAADSDKQDPNLEKDKSGPPAQAKK